MRVDPVNVSACKHTWSFHNRGVVSGILLQRDGLERCRGAVSRTTAGLVKQDANLRRMVDHWSTTKKLMPGKKREPGA